MKKVCCLLLLAILLLAIPFVEAGKVKQDLSDIVAKSKPEEKIPAIILLEGKLTADGLVAIKSEGASIKRQHKIINALSAQIPAKAVDSIAKKPFVKLVEPDYKVKLVLDKSALQIQADKVWSAGITGRGIDVAVVDTGIHNHPALTIKRAVDYTGEGTDDLNGHGTHVAGIVASVDATYKGIAYGAGLLSAKVLDKEGHGFSSDVITGIDWAVDNGAEVISLSLGAEVSPCDGTDALSMAIDAAVGKGLVVVVAAGNSGPDAGTITSPGCSREGITVGAVDDSDSVPSFSSRGATADGRTKPDLVAPGVGVISTWLDDSFKSLSGTSMATPHVSGAAALLLEANASLKPADVKNILKSTALDLDLDENTQGAGRVDAYKAYVYTTNITKLPGNETKENRTKENRTELLPPGLRKKEKELPPAFQRGLPARLRDWLFGTKFLKGIKELMNISTKKEEASVQKETQISEGAGRAEAGAAAEIQKPKQESLPSQAKPEPARQAAPAELARPAEEKPSEAGKERQAGESGREKQEKSEEKDSGSPAGSPSSTGKGQEGKSSGQGKGKGNSK